MQLTNAQQCIVADGQSSIGWVKTNLELVSIQPPFDLFFLPRIHYIIARALLHCHIYTYTCSMGGTSCQWASVSALMQQCHIQRSTPTYENTFLIRKANWILVLGNGKCSSHDCNWLTKWLLPGAMDQWENNKINKTHALWLFQISSAQQTNATQLSPGFLIVVWPRCKLKPFKVPTWRSFVIEQWLAKRVWICTQSHASD